MSSERQPRNIGVEYIDLAGNVEVTLHEHVRYLKNFASVYEPVDTCPDYVICLDYPTKNYQKISWKENPELFWKVYDEVNIEALLNKLERLENAKKEEEKQKFEINLQIISANIKRDL